MKLLQVLVIAATAAALVVKREDSIIVNLPVPEPGSGLIYGLTPAGFLVLQTVENTPVDNGKVIGQGDHVGLAVPSKKRDTPVCNGPVIAGCCKGVCVGVVLPSKKRDTPCEDWPFPDLQSCILLSTEGKTKDFNVASLPAGTKAVYLDDTGLMSYKISTLDLEEAERIPCPGC